MRVFTGRHGIVLLVEVILFLTYENNVNSYSDQIKFSWVCKFGALRLGMVTTCLFSGPVGFGPYGHKVRVS